MVTMKLYPCVVVLILGVTLTGLVSGDTVGGVSEDCNTTGTLVGGDDTASSAHEPLDRLTIRHLHRLVDYCWHNDSISSLHQTLSGQNDPEKIHQILVGVCNEDRTSIHRCEENVTATARCMTNEEQGRLTLYIQLRETILAVSCRDNATLWTNAHVGRSRMDPPLPPGKSDIIDDCYNQEEKGLGTPVEGVNIDMIQKTRHYKAIVGCLEKEDTPGWLEVVNAVKTLFAALVDNFVCLDHPGGGQVLCKTLLQE